MKALLLILSICVLYVSLSNSNLELELSFRNQSVNVEASLINGQYAFSIQSNTQPIIEKEWSKETTTPVSLLPDSSRNNVQTSPLRAPTQDAENDHISFHALRVLEMLVRSTGLVNLASTKCTTVFR
ncbi:hypothetical protein AltI4_17950 [Alteromonas sp. I4]|nr:hypothetical protein AltI4_17950 [Alteromonas sp. I4]